MHHSTTSLPELTTFPVNLPTTDKVISPTNHGPAVNDTKYKLFYTQECRQHAPSVGLSRLFRTWLDVYYNKKVFANRKNDPKRKAYFTLEEAIKAQRGCRGNFGP
jgi:hypothetical protein